MDDDLKKAKKKLEEGGSPTIRLLKALIKSKGVEPPEGKKSVLEEEWERVEDDTNWTRTIIFSDVDETTLELLEEDDTDNEE